MGADEAYSVGRRLREIRSWRGMTLRAVAGLAGVSESYLSRVERGQRTVDRRSRIAALAAALRVAPSDLTGQPYEPGDDAEASAHAAAQDLRAALRDVEVGGPASDAPPRPLPELRSEVLAVTIACAACDYASLGRTVPGLVSELAERSDDGREGTEARRLLADVLHAAFYLSKDLGHGDLAWMVSGHLHATAVALGDPAWGAVADFVRSLATVGTGARERGLLLAERGAELVEPDAGPLGEVYGMLHLSAALQSAVTGRVRAAQDHFGEAAATAARTGDGAFAGLTFGPRNVGVWSVALALETGEPGRAVELARGVDAAAIPSAGRQASFYGDVGRALAAVRGQEERAVEVLLRAEDLAPLRTRNNPLVREAVVGLLRRARGDAARREVRGMAYRMGLGVG